MAKKCPACNADNKDGALVCEYCGTRLSTDKPRSAGSNGEKRFCTSCGKPLAPDAAFCPFCGAKRNDVAPAPIQDPAARQVPIPPRTPVSQGLPDYMQPGYQQRVRAERETERQAARNAAKTKKGTRGLSLFLSLMLVVEFCVAGFKYPGFLLKDRVSGGSSVISDTGMTVGDTDMIVGADGSTTQTTSVVTELNDYQKQIASYLGATEQQLIDALNDPIEVTADNSPGNPAFLDLSFTEEEYAAAKTLTAPVSRGNPTADFPEFGIHVDLKWWNLENEEDTLIVKRMPTKTDSLSGSTLYTYDYSLASGQNRFPTNVAITVPIEGTEGLDNVLTIDPETGVWMEAYYEPSPDGKSYTFYMSHFTPGTAKSKTDEMLDEGLGTIKQFQYGSGKSIFGYYPREGRAKYEDTSHYLYTVGVVGTPDFEKFLLNDTDRADTILEDIVTKSGGIPAEAGLSESCSTLGEYGDKASIPQTVLGFLELPNKNSAANKILAVNTGFGNALYGFGLLLLGLRVADQYRRGVAADKIIESNKWGAASALVSTLGTMLSSAAGAAEAAEAAGAAYTIAGTEIAAASALTLGATVCTVVGVGILAATTVAANRAEEVKKKYPLGLPRTLEEGAYLYYLTEICKNDKQFKSNIDWPTYQALASHPGAIQDVMTALYGYHADAAGNGWANGLNYVFDKYKNDPVLLEKVAEAMYEFFIKRYDMLDQETKDRCWRESLARIMEDGSLYYYNDEAYMILVGNPEKDAKSLGISMEEFRRRSNIYRDMTVNGKTVDDIFADVKAGKYAYYPSSEEWAGYESRAREGLYANTNEIVYNLYLTKYQDAIIETRIKLYYEILPWMNTRITFYAHDTSLKKGVTYTSSETYRSLYDSSAPRYTFAFDVNVQKPLFLPGNRDSEAFQLYLRQNTKNPVLLETTVFHYLMWGCPTKVRIGGGGGGEKPALANWENVAVKVDPNATRNGLLLLLTQEGRYNIKDMKVPVEFGAEQQAESAYQMVLKSISPIEYEEPTENAKEGDWLTYTEYGADNTVTVTGDKVSISLNEIDYVWKNSSFGEDGESMVFTFKRDAVTLNGTLTEESEDDGVIIKKYTLKDPPPIKGSYKEEKAWDPDRKYYINKGMKIEEYTASEYAEFFSYSLTKEYKQTQSSGGTVTLQFDQSGTKLKRASITLNGSGEFKWWHNDRYAKVMAEVMETSGTTQQDISFLIVLRAPK